VSRHGCCFTYLFQALEEDRRGFQNWVGEQFVNLLWEDVMIAPNAHFLVVMVLMIGCDFDVFY